MEFVPRIKTIRKTSREPYSIPPKCNDIVEKAKLGKENLFMRELSAKCAFITTFTNEEAQIRAIGAKKLKYYHRVILKRGVIDELHRRCISCKGQLLGCLHPELRNCFEEILEGKKGEIVSAPILVPKGSVIRFLLLTLLDSKEDLVFTIKFVYETFRYCLPTLLNTIIYDLGRIDKINRELFLVMLSRLYHCFGNVNQVAKIILSDAVEITHSTEGNLYLVDPDHTEIKCKVFSTLNDKIRKLDLSHYEGIAGRVARTRRSIIVKRDHTNLLETVPGMKVKCIFSFPILYKGKLVCVIELYNKRGGDYMLQDCEISSMFCDYSGEVLVKCIHLDKLLVREQQSQFSSSMLTYHIKFSEASVRQMLTCTHNNPDFGTLEFEPRSMKLSDTVTWTMKIFESLKLLQKFKIDRKKFAKFILHIKFGYHDVPYHNWLLAFATLYFVFAVISSMKLLERRIISEFEALALLISTMAYKLDFRGHINAFKLRLNASLENMFGGVGQIMEIHHFTQLIYILRLNECNILENMDNATYSNFLEMVNKYIMLTDVTKRFYTKADQSCCTNIFEMETVPPRLKSLLMGALLQTAMLSDYIKDFRISLHAFILMRKEINHTNDFAWLPNNDLPKGVKFFGLVQLHQNFFKYIVRPPLVILAGLLPNLTPFLNNVHAVKTCWKYSQSIVDAQMAKKRDSTEAINRVSFINKVLTSVTWVDEHSEIDEVPSLETSMLDESHVVSDEHIDDEDRRLLAALEEDSDESIYCTGLRFELINP